MAPAAAFASPAPAGCAVTLRGLDRADLNGRRGFSLGQTAEQRSRGRVGVRLDDGREVSVPEERAEPLWELVDEDGVGVAAETARAAQLLPDRPLGRAGVHAVARRHIADGELLLRERPALVLRSGGPGSSGLSQADREAFKALPEERRRELMALSDAGARHGERKSLEGLVATNVLPKGPRDDGGVLCVLASRFNHSCRPNAEYLWVASSGVEEIHAVRPIAPGEEICVNYIGDAVRLPTAERRARLGHELRFECRCSLCAAPESEREVSDQRRARLGALDKAILGCQERPLEGLRLVDEMLQLLREEGISAPRTVAQVANDGYELALLAGRREEVKSWARRSYEAHRLGWGEDYPMTVQMKLHSVNPPSLAASPAAQAPARNASPQSKFAEKRRQGGGYVGGSVRPPLCATQLGALD
eukprot:TRINITY_DN18318_c0_g1_i1.p1 TRINITY_DN18318_c0_g1~~TRINITY_DN18318_c0_g1_i1.p1  ORF type:complete len:439 (+),score=91.48 TRINITY_DN18318_c0_g1_i1:61-1317(+)